MRGATHHRLSSVLDRIPLRRVYALAAMIMVAAVCACSESSPVAPAPTANASLISSLTQQVSVVTLGWRAPSAEAAIGSAVIGPEGGVFAPDGLGVTIRIPAGTVSVPTTFTARRLPGAVVAYEFGPHAVFNRPLTVSIDASQTTLADLAPGALQLEAGYFSSDLQLDQLLGLAHVSELRPATVGGAHSINFTVTHFSGYMLSVGRR